MDAKITSNGCRKAERKEFNVVDFRKCPQYVATIDFGTTHCSVAYLLHADQIANPDEVTPTLVQLDEEGNKRIPNCILFDNTGNCLAIGCDAREQYASMQDALRPDYYYFEHVKKSLQQEKHVDRFMKVRAINQQPFFLVDVIAHILHKLKCCLIDSLREFGYVLQAHNFDWVITVPAIWRAKGRKMMREAGYKAGLCSVYEPPNLMPAVGRLTPAPEVDCPDKLSLALEPESAAIHCRQVGKKASQSAQYAIHARNYLVLDIGGGTVDIATHGIVDDHMEELVGATGNGWGGTKVNEAFSEFLQEFVDDPKFSRYIGEPSTSAEQMGDQDEAKCKQARNVADLNYLLYTTFESQKVKFGSRDECRFDFIVRLPYTFWALYRDNITQKGRELSEQGNKGIRLQDEGQNMRISPDQMSEFFQPAVTEIKNKIMSHLSSKPKGFQPLGKIIDTIYWVGAFGGSKLLRRQLEGMLGKDKYHYSLPPEPEYAVIRGAMAFRCMPMIVGKRRADATYGIDTNLAFDPRLHQDTYKWWLHDEKKWMCGKLFSTFVEKGESVCTSEVFAATFQPCFKDQTSVCIRILSSTNIDVKYTDDPDVNEVATLNVQMGGTGLDREVEVVFDITHTEIQIRAYDKTSGKEVKAVADFLSLK